MTSGLVRVSVCVTGIVLGLMALLMAVNESDRASAADETALAFKLFVGNVSRDEPNPPVSPPPISSPSPTPTPTATRTPPSTSTPQGSSAYALVTSWYAHINDTLYGRYTAILSQQSSGQLTLTQAGAAMTAEKAFPDAFKVFLDGQATSLSGASPACNYARQTLGLAAGYLGLMEGWGGLILTYGPTPTYLSSREDASNKYFEFMSESLGHIANCSGSASGGGTPPLPPPPSAPALSTPTPTFQPTATPPSGGSTVIDTCIEGEFEGWSGNTVFELCNGQVWVQTSYSYVYHYAYRPDVRIVAAGGGYQMSVEGVTTSVSVRQVTVVARTCIDGSFQGFAGSGTLFPLCNGQVWKQTSYDYDYHYAYRPDVLIYSDGGFKMKVEGMSDSVSVTLAN